MNKYKGLLIDDNKGIRTTVINMLKIIDHECDAVKDIEEARQKISSTKYDYVLLDMEIPPDSSSEANTRYGQMYLTELRRKFAKEEFPIIVITGRLLDKAEYASDLLWAGANDFIPKPFATSGHTLEAAILKSLDDVRKYQEAKLALPLLPVDGWLTAKSIDDKTRQWTAKAKNGTEHTFTTKKSNKPHLLLECIQKFYLSSPCVPHGEIIDACGWRDKDYFPVYNKKRCPKRGVVKNQLSRLKESLGMEYEFVDIGIVFKQPEN